MHILRTLKTVTIANFYKKKRLPYFFERRSTLRNWFPLFLFYQSFFLDLTFIFSKKLGWLQKLPFIKTTHRLSDKTFAIYHSFAERSSTIVHLFYQRYFNDYYEFFKEPIEFDDGDVVVDIGAHVGTFCLPLAKIHANTRVLAYEPDPINFQCLLKGKITNKTDNITLHQCAVVDKPGLVKFSIGGSATTGSVSKVDFFLNDHSTNEIEIESTDLPAIFKKHQIERCKVLKVDCEGSEHLIFKNLTKEILEKIDYLFIEVHPIKGHDTNSLKVLLEGQGFIVKGRSMSSSKAGGNDKILELFCRNVRTITQH